MPRQHAFLGPDIAHVFRRSWMLMNNGPENLLAADEPPPIMAYNTN
jgi:hypothetical protein